MPIGIHAARLEVKSGKLTPLGLRLTLAHADFLLIHPGLPVLYTVAPSVTGGNGANSDAYSIGFDPVSGRMRILNKVDAGGRDATALAIDAASGTLFSANHGSGSVSAIPLQADGSLGAVVSLQKETGSGPNPRQRSAEPHDVVVDPSGHHVIVADFGADRLFIYPFDRSGRVLAPAKIPAVTLPAGSGPRHLAFTPDGRYFVLDTELTAELRSYRWDAVHGTAQLVQTLKPYPATGGGEKSGGDIVVSRDGRFAYLTLRGDQNVIVVYAIDARGHLTEIQRVPAQGGEPWNVGIDPSGQWLLVTDLAANSVVEFHVDPHTGRLSATGASLPVHDPVGVVFYPG